jgi:predicted nucleic-acid-binding Zn-ribbon protein
VLVRIFINMKNKYTESELREAVAKSFSYAEVCRKLNIRPVGGNYKTIKINISKFNIDITHFTGKAWNVGLKYKPFHVKIDLKDILVENSSYTNTNKLKQRLISEGLKTHKCEKCGNVEWLKEKIKLELHHINGVNNDNRIENILLLCPNCHATTNFFRGNNKLSALSEMKEVEYRKFRETLTDNADGNPEPSFVIKRKEGAETLHGIPKTKKYCICGNEIINDRRKFCSPNCYHNSIQNSTPKVPELLNMFEIYETFTKVGKYYNVSDNAVKKWCIKYGILDMVKRKSRPQK